MRRFDYTDNFEQQRRLAEFQRTMAERQSDQAQMNTTLAPAQRAQAFYDAGRANRNYEQTLGANQAGHERNLQGAAMDHKYETLALQRELGQQETEREGIRSNAMMGAFRGLGGGQQQVADGGGPGGIDLHDRDGNRIGGTRRKSPLSGLTRK
jgi:hypothetical protein